MAEDMIEFISACLAEDEAEIRKHPDGEDGHMTSGLFAAQEQNYPGDPYLQISKKRALAEVAAKRQLVELHSVWMTWEEVICAICFTGHPCPTLRLLALPYADRPGYREEWRPSAG